MQDYQKLRELLLKNKRWPLLYMFKFIVPNTEGKVDKVVAILPKDGIITFNHTKNLKYVSVTCKARMKSADDIISVTEQATAIEGVMAL